MRARRLKTTLHGHSSPTDICRRRGSPPVVTPGTASVETGSQVSCATERRHRRSLGLVSVLALTSAGIAACSNGGEDRPDLNAILADGDLALLMGSAASTESPAATIATGDSIMGVGNPVPVPGTGAGGSLGAIGAGGAGPAGPGKAGAGGAFMTGIAGTGVIGGFGGSGGGLGSNFPFSGQGLWQFEDCNASRTDLADSAVFSHPAFRSVTTQCRAGIVGQGVFIDENNDYVYVPDQPTFTFDNGLTVAAWVKPLALGGVRTIFRKRESGTSTFALVENENNFQLIIRLEDGKTADVTAPAEVDTPTHVAGTYDGVELRLYIGGALAARKRVVGALSRGAGPLLMGNDGSFRRIDGLLDNVFIDTVAATPEQVTQLACIPTPSTITAVPSSSGLVAPGTPVTYDVQITNNSCNPTTLFFSASPSTATSDLSVSPASDFRSVSAGATEHVALTVSSTPLIEPDDYAVGINAQLSGSPTFEFLTTAVTYSVQGTPCSVRSRKEIEIRDLSVVEDPVRTGPGGAWTFGQLMREMAPTPDAAPDMVERLLSTWLTDQTVNGFTVAARPTMQSLILGPFPRTKDGKLDLDRAPFRLLAIVNRIDLANVSKGSAGEGRFAFGVLDPMGNPLSLTMIVEYNIPASSAADVAQLAQAWHGLSALPFPSEQYNQALQAVTDRFTKRGAAPGRVNDSALGQVRSNDFFTLGEWEFREFHLSPTTGMLTPASPAQTPDRSFNGTDTLARFINTNLDAIMSETHTAPDTFEGQPFAAGSLITDFFVWQAPGVDPEARHRFARNTCNGCHTAPQETNVNVFQLSPRSRGQETVLSPFLTGTQVFDPFANVFRNFNELGRRARNLHALICPDEPLPPPPPDTIPAGVGGAGGFGVGGFAGSGSTGIGGFGAGGFGVGGFGAGGFAGGRVGGSGFGGGAGAGTNGGSTGSAGSSGAVDASGAVPMDAGTTTGAGGTSGMF